MSKINCAVYVRKSTEHGLEQEFNSLHNQEEACKAYILSQAYNGWDYYKTYADGGISGGTMERPALKEMLEEIRQKNIQTVVVYKVDRLSRSIIDFHNMMREFHKYDCNFVSVTQAFDTSNSMGKLTLNMLLSFAQFEQEVSSERVRDKIAASKAKGIWTGGSPCLGYDIVEKQLIPNEKEAKTVNLIFQKYLELGTLVQTREWLCRQHIYTKSWLTKSGRMRGGREFQLSALYRLLTNPLYIGKITHYACKRIYEGKHEGIVPQDLFKAVQARLGQYTNNTLERRSNKRNEALLAGRLLDEQGHTYKMTSCSKGPRQFKYYFNGHGSYLPRVQLDQFVLTAIHQADFKAEMPIDVSENDTSLNFVEAKACIVKVVCNREEKPHKLQIFLGKKPFIQIISKKSRKIDASTVKNVKAVLSVDGEAFVLSVPFVLDSSNTTRLKNTCSKNILTIHQMSESLVRGLALGWKFKGLIEAGNTYRELEKETHMQVRTIYRYLNLCYLSPQIVADILEYKNPSNMNLRDLMDLAESETDFTEQIKKWI